MNATVELETRFYSLEPGDTRYEFSITPAKADCDGFSCFPNKNFVLITIHDSYGRAGAYPTSLHPLRHLVASHIRYMHEKMPSVSLYTLIAILLACSVLIDEPENLDKACKRMLDAPKFL